MPKILVVEDDGEKLRRILRCLTSIDYCPFESIENVRDVVVAKRKMREHQYDLLILDIALPERSDESPSPDGGVKLLNDVFEHGIYKVPQHIVGLTAYRDILEAAAPRFRGELLHIIHYDPACDAWIDQLQRKVRHIQLAGLSAAETREHGLHLCIVTALQEPEMSSVLRLPWSWEKFDMPNDATIYYKGRFSSRGQTHEVVAATASRMGMTAAAVLSMKMINTFRPKYLGMTGILAGVRGRCELGDIVAADIGWDYGSGKWRFEKGEVKFSQEPYQIGLNPFLRSKLTLLSHDGVSLNNIRLAWSGNPPKTPLRMHLGPVASGAAVLSCPDISLAIQQQHRKLLGIEMETYGVFAAAMDCALPQPSAFSIKSVCDFADEEKNDDFQAYAAFTSAMALQVFAEQYL